MVFLDKVSDSKIRVAPISICYDDEQDVFLTTQETCPKIPKDACKCYKGQGYDACNCVASSIIKDDIVKWFREHHSGELDTDKWPVRVISSQPHSGWIESGSRDKCKDLFAPDAFDFSRLNHVSWCDSG
jgi:hypothetical protein